MKKKMLVMGMMLALLSMNAFSAKIETEDEADALKLNVFAEIEQTFRVSIDENGLDDALESVSSYEGNYFLGGEADVKFSYVLSKAANGCRLTTDAAPTAVNSVCTLAGDKLTAATTVLDFKVKLPMHVEIGGPGSVDLAVSSADSGLYASGFSAPGPVNGSTHDVGALDGAGGLAGLAETAVIANGHISSIPDTLAAQEDQDSPILVWHGQAAFNAGPTFEDVVEVVVTPNF